MSEIQKNHEDSYNQGNHNTGKINGPSNLAEPIQHSDVKVAPVNIPAHVFEGEWKEPVVAGAAASGVNLVYLTVDTEEHATRFIKDMFRLGYVSSV